MNNVSGDRRDGKKEEIKEKKKRREEVVWVDEKRVEKRVLKKLRKK